MIVVLGGRHDGVASRHRGGVRGDLPGWKLPGLPGAGRSGSDAAKPDRRLGLG